MSEQRLDSHVSSDVRVGPAQMRSAVGHLKWVFCGVLLCAVDLPEAWITVGGTWRIDPVNDLVGTLLILVGVVRLGRIRVDEQWLDRYGSGMKAVKWVVILSVAQAAMAHVVFPHPGALDLFLAVLGLAQLAAAVLFALCMRRLCVKAGSEKAGRSWSVFLAIFVCFYAIPVGFYHYSAYMTRLGGKPYRSDPTFMFVGGLVMSLILAALLAWTIRRTARAAEEAGQSP